MRDGQKLTAVPDSPGVPISVHAASAYPHEVTLVEETIEACLAPVKPKQLIGDRAYHSDLLAAELRQASTEISALHRKNKKKPKDVDYIAYKEIHHLRWWLWLACDRANGFLEIQLLEALGNGLLP